MKTIVKFYRARGQMADNLLDEAETAINAFLADKAPSGVAARAVTPQFSRVDKEFELVVTVVLDVPDSIELDTFDGRIADYRP